MLETVFVTASRTPLAWSRSNAPKDKARRLSLDRTDSKLAKIEAEIDALNRYWDSQTVEGATHEGFYRVFSCGDDPAFDWNKGGRLYSVGGGYQAIDKVERPSIRINGQPTVEIDISGCHLSILHGLAERQLEGDPYAVPGLPRPVVKAWTTMTLGSRGFHSRWSAKAIEYIRENIDCSDVPSAYPFGATQRLIRAKIPLLSTWRDSEVRWPDLQYIESQIIISTLNRLVISDIPALPLHDAIIVPVRNYQIAKDSLIQSFYHHVGILPYLKDSNIQTLLLKEERGE